LVAKDLEFIAGHPLFYSQNSMTNKGMFPKAHSLKTVNECCHACG